jgi:small-conductance mechanosensitive channel
VRVGVAYGSDTRLVESLLRQAVEAEEFVLKEKEVAVLFSDFGDDALVFEVLFWTSLDRPITLRQLESNLRFRIDQLFRDAGVTVAYPQRDVHLDTVRPLQVAIVGAIEAESN